MLLKLRSTSQPTTHLDAEWPNESSCVTCEDTLGRLQVARARPVRGRGPAVSESTWLFFFFIPRLRPPPRNRASATDEHTGQQPTRKDTGAHTTVCRTLRFLLSCQQSTRGKQQQLGQSGERAREERGTYFFGVYNKKNAKQQPAGFGGCTRFDHVCSAWLVVLRRQRCANAASYLPTPWLYPCCRCGKVPIAIASHLFVKRHGAEQLGQNGERPNQARRG